MIETPSRQIGELDLGWEFVRGRVGRSWLAGQSGAGEPVQLPHCWNESDTFQYGRRSYSGWGAYRRAFEWQPLVSAGDGFPRLRIGPFYGLGDVWLDGRRLAKIDGQYLGCAVDLPASLSTGRHRLGLRLDNRAHRNVLPATPSPDFILHGGLTGGVWLEWTPALHFDLDRVEVVCERVASRQWRAQLRWKVTNRSSADHPATVRWTITDEAGAAVVESPALPAASGSDAEELSQSPSILLSGARCWSPDDPQLYWAEGRLSVDGGVVDTVRVRFGVVHAEFRPRQGLFLEGQRIDLHGCNRHEAIPGLGSALPPNLQRRDAQILKELGCNFVRLSHYPQSPAFLDACDELGLLVYAEIATWKSVRSARGFRRAARRQLHDLIVRDRHRPSILLWGMGNESRSRKAFLELATVAHELDPGRAVTYAENHLYRARRKRTVGIPDVWGVNYELEVLEEAAAACRLANVVLTECCNHPHSVRGDDFEELTQVYAVEREWKAMGDRAYLAGHAVWCLTDYATEHRERCRRLPGLFDAWRNPKMAAELFRARYSVSPFVALFVTAPGPERPASSLRLDLPLEHAHHLNRELHVFTNCPTLRLATDSSTSAELKNALHYVVGIEGDFTEIVATGSRGGSVARTSLRRHGDAAQIEISVAEGPLPAGGSAEVRFSIHDAVGRPAWSWNGHLQLGVEGPARWRAYSPDGTVQLARGVGRSYLTAGSEAGEVRLTASASGLEPGRATIRVG